MRPRRADPPRWFLLLVAAGMALALRALDAQLAGGAPAGVDAPPMLLGFWGFVIAIGAAIWEGIKVAGAVTLEVLKWIVANLALVVAKLVNGLKVLGVALLKGLKGVWKFFDATYSKVIKPGFLKLWRWFNKATKWLDETFGPVVKWLRRVRDAVTEFYKTFIRPWLDVIDVTRRMLRVFSRLGFAWARELDRRLDAIAEQIDRPFRLIVAKLNEAIGIINRVITLDGLVQRAALLGSLVRDIRHVWRAALNWRLRPLTAAQLAELARQAEPRTPAEIQADFNAAAAEGGGPYRALSAEQAVSWAILLRVK